ncbi:bifunctional NAD(P)H-hydrate repair enzyme Nnr [Peptococcaceae bacterium CEB3]|nr:bifunctional NAD(P)H-hydrate repair enzyme Nnr [Peptococcaceae bacterium CEB3]
MRVVNSEQMRQIEERAIKDYGIPSLLLMENAALAVVREIRTHFADLGAPDLKGHKAVVLVGKGNNGGDGLAVARHLVLLGMGVTVFLFSPPEDFRGDAALNLRLYQGTGAKFFVVRGDRQHLTRLALNQAEVIVDAIYGTGFKGALSPFAREYVEQVNQASAWVISVDIPSGVEAGSGNVSGAAVRAEETVTFGLPKLGHYLGDGPDFTGKLVVDPISIPETYFEVEAMANFVLTDRLAGSFLPRRLRQGHKGRHGRGILVAGSPGMSGAAILAGRAALRTGVGLLQIIAPSQISALVDGGVVEATVWPGPEEQYLGLDSWSIIRERCQAAQALAVGPGLGQNPEFLPVLEKVLHSISLPLVLDADALNLIAAAPDLVAGRQGCGPLILTPHPGEMARLCRLTVAEVQANRLELAISKAVEWEATVVLKGAVTIVAAPDGRAFLNPTGNPGLGAGGTGDVLTGSILAWLAQGVNPVEAACLGVYIHGKAGDLLAQTYGWSGYTAGEVAETLPLARRALEEGGTPEQSPARVRAGRGPKGNLWST